MKHIKKTVSRFMLLGLIASCGFFAFQGINRGFSSVSAEGEEPTASVGKTYTAADFADEEEAGNNELGVSIIESTTTETSQSLNFAFKSITSEGFRTARANYIITITDTNYTGSISAPVPEDYDNFMEVENSDGDLVTLPVLEGTVSFVLGGATKDVCLPSIMIRDGSFVIKVTSISQNCVTAAGDGYRGVLGNNSWYDEGGNLKINGIYIPETIEHVPSNAFTGVPSDVVIAYEGASLSSAFASDWTDAATITYSTYKSKSQKEAYVGGKVDDMTKPANFILGCQESEKNVGEEYNRPLIIQYDKIKDGNKETIYEELPLTNTVGNPYDSVGEMSSTSYSRLLSYKLGPGESIDDESIVFHNLMKASDKSEIDTSKTYWAKPVITYQEKLELSKLLTFKASSNSTFAGFSMFSLTMDKNLSITSEKYPEPHSLYLDVKSDLYEQNKLQIQKGTTIIRYSLNNLYLSKYHFVYEGRNGELKEVFVPITSVIYYQILEKDSGNKVSIILENKKVADDFSADKVRTFELMNITIQMDLFTTSSSGSTSVLGKSAITYKFAYITVRSDETLKVFNWNIFLVIFFIAYIALYSLIAFVLYKVLKEKFKNDEFRRINDKKYLKSAILTGLGTTVIAAAIVFIAMRVGGFANTIVAFNPTDPLLIVFSVAGMIIGGYFIVIIIKAVKAEKERRKAIRLKLNEDVEDDGTN